MPNYEYQCKKCGCIFEREHAIGEKIQYKCPECSSSDTNKLISQVGVIFKGSGFYATDHRGSCCSNGTCSHKQTKSSGNGETCESPICPSSDN
ncbi:MAG: FmdB family zinc ribbon protein [bacterium]